MAAALSPLPPVLCRLVEDTAWHPMMKEQLENMPGPAKAFYKFFLGSPFKLWASIGHWWIWHFDLNKYTEAQVGAGDRGGMGGRGEGRPVCAC